MLTCTITFIAPSVAPRSFIASDITSEEFRLSWAAPKTIDTNGVLRNYILSVAEYKSNLLFLDEVEIEAFNNETEFTVSYLTPYTLYNCSVLAVTVERGPSAVIQARTGEEGEV